MHAVKRKLISKQIPQIHHVVKLTIMKDTIIKKLTIVIEATNYKSISNEVMKMIHTFEQSIASTQELKLSLALNENDTTEMAKTKNADYVSPENWDYWPV